MPVGLGRRARWGQLFVDHVASFYDETWDSYDDWAGGVHRRAAVRTADVAEPRPGEQILDVGCGTGLVSRLLAAEVGEDGRVVGVDISGRSLEEARRRSPRGAVFLQMPAERLVLRSRSFDAVVMGQVLGYVTDVDAALAHAHRVLRPGGRIAICCQRRSLTTPAQTAFFDGVSQLARRHPMHVPRLGDDRALFGEPRVIRTMLRRAGFRDIDLTYTVVGGGGGDAASWTDMIAGAGPYPHALLSVLGPERRRRFEDGIEERMEALDEEAYRYHHAFTLVTARRL